MAIRKVEGSGSPTVLSNKVGSPRSAPSQAAVQPVAPRRDAFGVGSTRSHSTAAASTLPPDAAAVDALVQNAYRTYLRREPDAGGLAGWTKGAADKASAGQSTADIQAWLEAGFVNSPEFKALGLVDRTFEQELGRSVAGSRGYWHEEAVGMARDGGLPLSAVESHLRASFRASDEFKNNQSVGLVEQAFQEVLERSAGSDPNGYWQLEVRGMLDAGRSDGEILTHLRASLRGSDEYRLGRLDELVNGLYQRHLGRDADPEGLAGWTGLANELKGQGSSLAQIDAAITAKLVGSDEYKIGKAQRLVNQAFTDVLGRPAEPNPDGYWQREVKGMLDSGASEDQILQHLGASLRASDEFRQSQSQWVSVDQLLGVMPNLPRWKAEQYVPHLNAAMAEADITTPRRKAAFLAQLAHESVQLNYFEEIADGSAYEWRGDLGNVYAGDGRRYKGRGPIQLTGRSNYRSAGAALGLDLEGNPLRAADADVGFRVAGWFWNSRNLNAYADAGNFDAITYRVNGGFNGKADRDAYYWRALSVFGA